MKKLLYVCEADSGGIMEYAIRQSEAIAREGVEFHFLCKSSFPVERLADGIKVWEFDKSRGPRDQRRGLAGKILRVLRIIADLRCEAKQVENLAVIMLTRYPQLVTTSALPKFLFSSLVTRNTSRRFGWGRSGSWRGVVWCGVVW